MKPFLAVFALLLVAAQIVWAATVASTTARLQAFPITVTSQGASGTTVAEGGADTTGNPNKAAIVHEWTVNGQDVVVLVRAQYANGRLWLDLVSDASIASLTDTVTGLDLDEAVIGHPAPAKDATDASAMVAAGGS